MNREEILTNIEQITIACQKKNSNAREGIENMATAFGFSQEVADSVFEELSPFTKNGHSWIVDLGTQIVDSEEKQTMNNVNNFYTMVNRDSVLCGFLALKGIEPLTPSIKELLELFGL